MSVCGRGEEAKREPGPHSTYMYTYTYTYLYMHLHTYVAIYIYMYVCMYMQKGGPKSETRETMAVGMPQKQGAMLQPICRGGTASRGPWAVEGLRPQVLACISLGVHGAAFCMWQLKPQRVLLRCKGPLDDVKGLGTFGFTASGCFSQRQSRWNRLDCP